MTDQEWFLTAAERGNHATELDHRRGDGAAAWSGGNTVTPLVHGATYFARLVEVVTATEAGDVIMFTDWRGDPDERLDEPGAEVSRVLCEAAGRGVIVKGLIWRSHWDRLAFSAEQNRHLGEDINAAGGECIRDMRVRPGGSHHQKFVVVRHARHPERDVAFAGGIDLCHSRRDTSEHHGDPQRQPMSDVYGPHPPWHDIQLEIRGPAVGDLEFSFRERWNDPTPVSLNPAYRVADVLRRDDDDPSTLPAQPSDPSPVGTHLVQVLRTYPSRRPRYPFAPDGERSIARAYRKVLARAHRLVYVEDQYLWSDDVASCFADALAANSDLLLVAVIPHHPDQDGRLSLPMNLVGRRQALDLLNAAAPGRVGVYGIENHHSNPVYVHAKVCVIDDVWASVGSDNFNRRSWTHDSELSCAVIDQVRDIREPRVVDRHGDGARVFARNLRLELAREHLDRDPGDDADLVDPGSLFTAFAEAAQRLQHWHDSERTGLRPPGRLRPYQLPRLSPSTMRWAGLAYRTVADPDGRPRHLRRTHTF
ncbi:phospholipase D family protein [Actinopolymorpha singaporensis]|uniref:Phosphatidylserine/phosphatidylglycerophosphate/cardiolipin synthase n=1 Tax=Actinopolymorpha singaporensis TaxID=117157 RepID=A0A1H1MTX7_9ACTN|nr:phospholipase D family protein [Actinopolymorpha singaporensis]SDR89865.1 Phosphatidylserine/phosphatidylglycerophosphate/cardiolipin synthase [Actinopolymorpha singaporensis]